MTIAYDGARFSGWQSQPGGETVQDAVERAFLAVCPSRVAVHGAGRTDAGVHAEGQCAHADVPDGRLALDAWAPALNAHLPEGVRVMAVRRVPATFHARFDATGKEYRYTIWNGPVLPPLLLGRAWHVPWKLDRLILRAACVELTGTHNFAAFSARRSKEEVSTVRTVESIRISTGGSRIRLTFRGPGFLYKMVRILTAAAVRCACGRMEIEELRQMLAAGTPRFNHVAPAGGLCLMRVTYSRPARRPS